MADGMPLGAEDVRVLLDAADVLARLSSRLEWAMPPEGPPRPVRADDADDDADVRVVPSRPDHRSPPAGPGDASAATVAALLGDRPVRLAGTRRQAELARQAALRAPGLAQLAAAEQAAADHVDELARTWWRAWQDLYDPEPGPLTAVADARALTTRSLVETAGGLAERSGGLRAMAAAAPQVADELHDELHDALAAPPKPGRPSSDATQRARVVGLLAALGTPVPADLLARLLIVLAGANYPPASFGRLRSNERRRVATAVRDGRDRPDPDHDGAGWLAKVLDGTARPVRGLWRLAAGPQPLALDERTWPGALARALARLALDRGEHAVDPAGLLTLAARRAAGLLDRDPPADDPEDARAFLLAVTTHVAPNDPWRWPTRPSPPPGMAPLPGADALPILAALFGPPTPPERSHT